MEICRILIVLLALCRSIEITVCICCGDKSSLHPFGSLLDSLIYSECVDGLKSGKIVLPNSFSVHRGGQHY